MQILLNAFWQIVLFRQGPESLPDSRPLLMLAAVAYIFTGCLGLLINDLIAFSAAQSQVELPLGRLLRSVLVPVVLDLLLLVGSIFAALFYFGFAGRLRQTMIAIFGASALLQVLTWPLYLLLVMEGQTTVWAIVMLLLVLLLLWSIAVYGHILSHAISRSFGSGIGLATLYFFVNYQMYRLIPEF